MSNKIESIKKCYQCIDLQGRNKGLKRELKERKECYEINIFAGVSNKALKAQKRVIKDLKFRISENKNQIDFHGNHG